MKEAFFLKINRSDNFAIDNLSRWIDVAYLMDADCYIICDRDDVTKRIKEELVMSDYAIFLQSIKNDETKQIVEKISRARVWHNAAYAHLSTFIYAKEYGYDCFWNIDADDTWMCLPIKRLKKALRLVEQYADDNYFDALGLDMWRTVKTGKAWTFGVTYTDNRIDWINAFIKYGSTRGYDKADNIQIDSFFSFLSKRKCFNIGTFYFENLRFIHYATDLLKEPVASGIYHWHDGVLEFPIRDCFGISEYSGMKICEDVVRFDIGITDKETRDVFTYYTRDINDLGNKSNWNSIVDSELCTLKQKKFMERHDNANKVVLFGAGHGLKYNYKKYTKLYDVCYVCDNDRKLWGKTIYKGIKCISPKELVKLKKSVVVITIYSMATSLAIKSQLNELGIKEVDYMKNWLRCAE